MRSILASRYGPALAASLIAGLVAGCAGANVTAAPATLAIDDPAITLQAPASAAAGSSFEVSWTGAQTTSDFLVIVPAGSTTWVETAESPYVNASMGNPITLTAPKAAGDYEVWFCKGDLGQRVYVKAKAPLKVT